MEYNEKKELIKIITILMSIILFGIILNNYLTSPTKAYEALDNYLKKTYGEEFVIDFLGEREIGYEARRIFPKRYLGTSKEHDSYYWGRGFVESVGRKFEAGDTYGKVLLNESANNFYLPKLKELFGENVLPILNVEGQYDEIEFSKEMEIRLKLYKKKPDLNYFPLSGVIYIFGRVENDKDREWYRKQIYEFVQFMKQTETFEYVDLGVVIWDERVLSEEFRTNEDLRKAILVARNMIDDDKKFIKERKRLMKQTDESMKKLTKKEKDKVLNSYIKSDIYGVGNRSDEIFVYNKLLGMKIYSPKYIESQGLTHREKTNYEKVEDVKFWSELY